MVNGEAICLHSSKPGVGNYFGLGVTFGRPFLAEGRPSNGNKNKSLTS